MPLHLKFSTIDICQSPLDLMLILSCIRDPCGQAEGTHSFSFLNLLIYFNDSFLHVFIHVKIKYFSGDSDGKESPCNVGDSGLIPVLGRSPWRREWLPVPVFLPGESDGQDPDRLQSIEPQRVRHSWETNTLTFTSFYPRLNFLLLSLSLFLLFSLFSPRPFTHTHSLEGKWPFPHWACHCICPGNEKINSLYWIILTWHPDYGQDHCFYYTGVCSTHTSWH